MYSPYEPDPSSFDQSTWHFLPPDYPISPEDDFRYGYVNLGYRG